MKILSLFLMIAGPCSKFVKCNNNVQQNGRSVLSFDFHDVPGLNFQWPRKKQWRNYGIWGSMKLVYPGFTDVHTEKINPSNETSRACSGPDTKSVDIALLCLSELLNLWKRHLT